MHINLRRKDHKSSDNLLYFSNLFSVKHIKQILVKHSIKKGERLGEMFPLWYALHFLEFLMKHRCSTVPTRMVSRDQIGPRLISETSRFPSSDQNAWPSPAEWTPLSLNQNTQRAHRTYQNVYNGSLHTSLRNLLNIICFPTWCLSGL